VKRRFIEFVLVSLIFFVISLTGSPVAVAASSVGKTMQTTAPEKNSDKTDHENLLTRAPSVTKHSITVNGKILKYTATTGYLPLKDESGKPEAYVFFTAYTRDDVERKSLRPVTFAFNGGPGAASVWLHLGALSPKRAIIVDEEKTVIPPYRLVANDETWLDLTDLFFIDPVGTGYSRAAAGDVTNIPEKQIIIAAGEGAKAALQAYHYLQKFS
jgi:carboxypeptidase C (cathepsin A)